MEQLIKINTNENGDVVISGRELHEFLEIGTDYKKWFDRMKEYGFSENIDFATVSQKSPIANGGYQEKFDHAIKLDMAKELAMIQRNEKGKQARQYFIAIEKEYNSPEKIMARALQIADKTIKTLQIKIEQNKPKVLFADAVSTSHTSILVGDLAKLLKQNGYNTGGTRLFKELRKLGYLMKKGTSENLPTQRSMEMGLFEVKERTINNPDGSIRITQTTKVTGKGQQYFINLFLKQIEKNKGEQIK